MKFRLKLFVIGISVLCLSLHSQQPYGISQRGDYRIMFYNVENLFDTVNNPRTDDEEYLLEGTKRWNSYKYWEKLKKIFQVIAAVGEESPPEIIGLCEVENSTPLYNLVYDLPLSKYKYKIIHKESPDLRGIDVAILYRYDKVKLLSKKFIRVKVRENPNWTTRDILYAKLKTTTDTLHVFVNHWPSRWGGELRSKPYRLAAAEHLKKAVDSVQKSNPAAKVIIMGDFNDEPQNESVQRLLSTTIINLSDTLERKCRCGTLKFKSEWQMFDQILVSKALLTDGKLMLNQNSLKVFNPEFLLLRDNSYGGNKPFRTYLGPRYQGGYSDHLPVVFDLFIDRSAE